TGRPPFREWLKALNAKLDVGHRIMGAFDNWTHGLRQYRYDRTGGNERLSPARAEYPDDAILYTIEGRENRMWFFRYARGETIYRKPDRWTGRFDDGPAKRRASCRISPDDEFILNFDDASVADMTFYLNDRTNRHAYEQMFPLLRKAIELKMTEA